MNANDDVALADFYFYTVGDKTTYNKELDELFLCYELSRGLQKPCNSPRRPPLPLELILRIIRFAGFMDPKPDFNLTMDAVILAKVIGNGVARELYITERLTRVQLASMARLQLVELPCEREPIYDFCEMHPYTWAFVPLGNQDEESGLAGNSRGGIVAALFPCHNEMEATAIQSSSQDAIFGETFPLDHVISQQLEEGAMPCVVIISRERARLLVWRWWEPKF